MSGALTAVLAASIVLFVFRPLSVVDPGTGLDESWMAVLGEAGTHPVRWGVDLAFSYGPASAILTRYFTDRYLIVSLPVVAAMAMSAAAVFVMVIRTPALSRHPARLVLAAVVLQAAALATQVTQDADGFVLAFVFAVYVLDVVQPRRTPAARCALAGGAACLGVLALAKTSFGVFGLLLFGLADIRSIGLRRMPWLTPPFLVTAFVTYLAYGQRPGDLPAFLTMQWSFAAGYAEAMSIDGNHLELCLYLAASAALVAIATGRRGRGPEQVWIAVGLAATLWLGLKAGFVRADSHTQIAWSLLGLAGLSVAAALLLPKSPPSSARLAAMALLILWVWAPLMLILDTHRPKRWAELASVYGGMIDATAAEATAWSQFVQDPLEFASQAHDDKDAAWDAVRDQMPLPQLVGTVDILPSRQSGVLANRLAFDPRPSFQDYATYDRRLVEANTAFYAGSTRPDWVLLGLSPIDTRYPASSEGALWPVLLNGYEALGRTGPLVVLRARPGPYREALGAPEEHDVGIGEVVAPPPGVVFATVQVHRTLVGTMAAVIFRTPALRLNVTTQDGSARSFRLVPAIAEAGLVVSPLVGDASDFAALAQGTDMEGKFVTAMSVTTDAPTGLFYDRMMTVTFRALRVGGPTSETGKALARHLGLAEFDRAER